MNIRLILAAATLALTAFGAGAAPATATPPPPAPVVQFVAGPKVPADENGVPLEECNETIDGKRVETWDSHGGERIWVCKWSDPLFEKARWSWHEIVRMGG